MERMLVTQGLNELKTLENRINRTIRDAKFVASAKTIESKVTPNVTKDEFANKAKADMASILDLINRREKIKAAIVDSNAKTIVTICNEQMSVAKAIDTKTSIEFRRRLFDSIDRQYADAVSTMNRKNADMERNLNTLIEGNFTKESKTSFKPEDYEAIANPYRKANEYSLVDPCKVEDFMKKEETYIDEFLSTVDQILQISNCITYIEF